jgi:cell division protein FtsI (penicillin-binding protein 3)
VNKVITLAAALESGVTTPSTGMEVPDHYTVADHEFTDDHNHEPEVWTPTDILVSSSNVGTIKIAQELGPDRLDAALRRFGLGAPTGLDFPRETRGRLLDPAEWSGTSLGSIAIGQGISVTAMQMLGAFNVIANDGTYVAPRLVDATVGPDGTRRKTPVGARRRVVSEDTARTMQAMMAKVVSEQSGTGTRAQVPGYTVAGKTGTAAKPVPGGYSTSRYVASFVGVVPAKDPRLVVLVQVDEPHGAIWGGVVAAPAFAEIARSSLVELEVAPDATPDSTATR